MSTEKNSVTFLKESCILIAFLFGLIIVEYFLIELFKNIYFTSAKEGKNTTELLFIGFLENDISEYQLYGIVNLFFLGWHAIDTALKEEKTIFNSTLNIIIILMIVLLGITEIIYKNRELFYYFIAIFLSILAINSIILDQVKKFLAKWNFFCFAKKRKSHKLWDFFSLKKILFLIYFKAKKIFFT